jgi:hypothetical protein
MASDWFCRIADTEIGPLSAQQLKAMAVKGRLTPEDEIRRGTDGEWNPAGAVTGLFPQADSSAAWADTAEIPTGAAKKTPAAKPAAKPKLVAARPIRAPKPAPAAPKPAAAAPKPAAVEPQPANPLDAFVSDFSSVVKHSSRRSGDGKATKQQKHQQEKTLWTVCGIGFVVLLVVGAIALLVMWNRAKDKALADDAKSDAKTAAKTESKPESKTESKPAAKTESKTESKPAEKTAAEAPKKETPKPETPEENETWVDASSDTIQRGDVKIKVASVSTDKPRVFATSGQPSNYRTNLLLIAVELQNTGKKKIEYAGWNTPGSTSNAVELTDNLSRPYVPVKPPSGYKFEGQLAKVAIQPDDTAEDLLAFPTPKDDGKVKFLRLKLPAAAFGEKGSLCFKIPLEMIKAAPKPEPPKRPENPVGKLPPIFGDDAEGAAKKPDDPETELDKVRRAHEQAMEETAPGETELK